MKMAGRLKKPYLKASSSVVPPPPPPWVELPWDITANVLQRLGAKEILESAQKVCTTWRKVCKQPSLWRKIHLSQDLIPRPLNMEIMCRHAVDRSQGQLQDISLVGFGSNSLLNYIAQRSSDLRRLSLERCSASKKGLVEVAKGFPLLEELRLCYILVVDAEVIECFFRSCPFLKSFTLCEPALTGRLFNFDPDARSIAKIMSQLHHLCICGDWMLKEDLVAILDGCTHLESLHLEECSGLYIDDHLAKRLSQQIKHLKLSESTPHNYTVTQLLTLFN